MTTAIALLRFSPRPNAAECESLATQAARINEYAFGRQYTIRLTCFDRAKSGAGKGTELDPSSEIREKDRPGLWMALNALQKGEVLLIYKRDRLARCPYASEYIRRKVVKKGARIESLQGMNGDTPNDQLFVGILNEVSKFERLQTKERTRDAHKRLREESRYASIRVPFGYTTEIIPGKITRRGNPQRRLVPLVHEQITIEAMANLRLDKKLGWRSIAAWLNSHKLKCRGHWWCHQMVRRVLRREKPDLPAIRGRRLGH